jgi:hypothetical protein
VAIKIGQLVVQLEADVAQLKSGMEEARAEARKTAKELSHQMKDEARGSVQLLGDEIGVRIPRELQKVLAQSSLVGPALSAAFKGVALVAFISLAAEAASKLGEFTDALAGYTTAVQKAEQSEIAFNDSLLLGFKTVKQGEAVLDGLRKTLQDLETQSRRRQRLGSPPSLPQGSATSLAPQRTCSAPTRSWMSASRRSRT